MILKITADPPGRVMAVQVDYNLVNVACKQLTIKCVLITILLDYLIKIHERQPYFSVIIIAVLA